IRADAVARRGETSSSRNRRAGVAEQAIRISHAEIDRRANNIVDPHEGGAQIDRGRGAVEAGGTGARVRWRWADMYGPVVGKVVGIRAAVDETLFQLVSLVIRRQRSIRVQRDHLRITQAIVPLGADAENE